MVLSTDEESSSEEASDLDELGKDLESMLSNKKNKQEVYDSFHVFLLNFIDFCAHYSILCMAW